MFRIKQCRKIRGIDQTSLAQKIGITREYLSAIENGHKDPSISLLKKIAKVLNTTIKDLIEENEHC